MSLATSAEMSRAGDYKADPASLQASPSHAVSIPSLTGIRGIAAVWVLLTHYQAVMAAYLQSPAIEANRFLYNGFRGVDLFFVLSGFILMHVHGGEFRTIERETVRRFYVLRFFRIYPLNTAVLLALVPLALGWPAVVDWFRFDHGVPIPYHSRDFSAAGFVQSLFLAQTWTVLKLGEWNGPAWSLSAEVVGYAAFPMLAAVLMRRRSVSACVGVAGASLAVLMVLLVLGHHTQDSPTGSFGLVRFVFGFIAGAAMARAFQLRGVGEAPAWGVSPVVLAWSSVGVIVAAVSFRSLNMFVVFGFCGLIYALAFQRGAVDRLLSSRPVMFLGRISFSLYMIHYIPLKLSTWFEQTHLQGSGLAVRVVCLAAIPCLCIGLAMLAFNAVELPFQRYARRILRKRRGSGLHTALTS